MDEGLPDQETMLWYFRAPMIGYLIAVVLAVGPAVALTRSCRGRMKLQRMTAWWWIGVGVLTPLLGGSVGMLAVLPSSLQYFAAYDPLLGSQGMTSGGWQQWLYSLQQFQSLLGSGILQLMLGQQFAWWLAVGLGLWLAHRVVGANNLTASPTDSGDLPGARPWLVLLLGSLIALLFGRISSVMLFVSTSRMTGESYVASTDIALPGLLATVWLAIVLLGAWQLIKQGLPVPPWRTEDQWPLLAFAAVVAVIGYGLHLVTDLLAWSLRRPSMSDLTAAFADAFGGPWRVGVELAFIGVATVILVRNLPWPTIAALTGWTWPRPARWLLAMSVAAWIAWPAQGIGSLPHGFGSIHATVAAVLCLGGLGAVVFACRSSPAAFTMVAADAGPAVLPHDG